MDPVHQLGGAGLLFDVVHLADAVEGFQGLLEQGLVQLVEVDADDFFHLCSVREADIMKDTTAQEGTGQLFLCVGGDDDDGAMLCLDGLASLRDIELHLVQLPQQVVGEFQVGLVDLIDQQNHLFISQEGFAQLAQLDILGNIVHAGVAELAVVQTLHHVVNVQTVLRLGGRLDIPDDQLLAQGFCNGFSQHGLARARFPLDQQGFFQCHSDVDSPQQIFRSDIIAGASKCTFHNV